jgi:hypothetical protein
VEKREGGRRRRGDEALGCVGVGEGRGRWGLGREKEKREEEEYDVWVPQEVVGLECAI